MRWRRRNNRKALKLLALSFAASAIFAGSAIAAPVVHDGGVSVAAVEQGGVTPTNLARAYVQPGMELSVPQADGSSWIGGEDIALGFGLGLVLATAAAIALAMSRGRERVAHP